MLRVTQTHDYDVIGELVDAPESGFSATQAAANPFPILQAPPARTSAIPVR
jgi:hypothetical protein